MKNHFGILALILVVVSSGFAEETKKDRGWFGRLQDKLGQMIGDQTDRKLVAPAYRQTSGDQTSKTYQEGLNKSINAAYQTGKDLESPPDLNKKSSDSQIDVVRETNPQSIGDGNDLSEMYPEMTWDDAVIYCQDKGGLPSMEQLGKMRDKECLVGGRYDDKASVSCERIFWSSELKLDDDQFVMINNFFPSRVVYDERRSKNSVRCLGRGVGKILGKMDVAPAIGRYTAYKKEQNSVRNDVDRNNALYAISTARGLLDRVESEGGHCRYPETKGRIWGIRNNLKRASDLFDIGNYSESARLANAAEHDLSNIQSVVASNDSRLEKLEEKMRGLSYRFGPNLNTSNTEAWKLREESMKMEVPIANILYRIRSCVEDLEGETLDSAGIKVNKAVSLMDRAEEMAKVTSK